MIVEYLDTLARGRLIPATGRERAEVGETWEALADGLLDAAILVRLENTFEGRSESQRSPAWIDRQMGKGRQPEGHGAGPGRQAVLQRHPPEPVRHRRGLRAGLAVVPLPEIDWRAEHPNLARLMDKLALRPSFSSPSRG